MSTQKPGRRSPLTSLTLVALAACGSFEAPGEVRVNVEAPLRVEVFEEFDVVVTVTNEAAGERSLVDLDIADELLEGLHVRSMDPPFSQAEHIPIDNTQSYSLDLPLPAGASTVVTVRLAAVREGDFRGDFDLCIDSAISCLSFPVRTIVVPEGTVDPGAPAEGDTGGGDVSGAGEGATGEAPTGGGAEAGGGAFP